MALYKQIFIIYQAIFAYFFNFFKKILWQLKKIEAHYYFNSRQKQIAVILLMVIAGIFLFYQPANATVGDAVRGIINWLCLTLIVVFGKLLNMLISFLMEIAKYNDFIGAPVVEKGWMLVRDVSNMFFVIVLLVIAFATVLRIQTYSYKNLLKKLIIMALLINFSKTICGFLIDFAQVIMLTFVNAFRNAGYNLVEMLKLTKTLELAQAGAGGQPVDDWNITGALVIGLLLLIVASVVVLIFLLVLIARIVYLWLLVTLSPLAFFLSSFPGGQQYASRWWDYFTKQLVVGPLLAFFLWLSLAAASGGLNVTITGQGGYTISEEDILQGKTPGTEAPQSFASEALTPTNMLSFITSIALLLAGLIIAQEAGGLTGSIAGKGLAKIQSTGTGILTGKIGPTPMRWARERIKAYTGMREDLRKQKAAAGGAKLLALEGGIRRGVTAPIRGVSEKLREKAAEKFEAPEPLEERVKTLRTRAEELKKRGEAGRASILTREADELQDRAVKAREVQARLAEGKPIISPLMISRMYWDKKAEAQIGLASKFRDKGETEKAEELESRAANSRRLGKVVQAATTGVAAGAAIGLGPLAWGLAPGGILGAKFLNWQGKHQLSESERYKDRAENYKYAEIMKEKDGMKNLDISEVIKISDDISAPAFKRQAAILHRLEKGYYPSTDIGKTKILLDNLGADKKTMSYYDHVVAEKFPQYSTQFTRDRKTGELLELEGIIKQLTAAFKDGRLNAHDLESGSFTSQGGRTAYAALVGITPDQLIKTASKSAEHKKKLGEGSGEFLVNYLNDILKLDDTKFEEMKADLSEGGGRDRLDDLMKVIGRHFYAAEKKNELFKIFGIDEKGKIKNSKLLEDILNRDDSIQLIANVNPEQLNDAQKSLLIRYIINFGDAQRLEKSLSTMSDGKDFQKKWANELLAVVARLEDEGEAALRAFGIKEKEKFEDLIDHLTTKAKQNTPLSRLDNAALFRGRKRAKKDEGKIELTETSEET